MSLMQFTVIPKSDQLNFDDFITGQGKVIKITAVKINPTAAEQRCTINYEGDNGKPYKPNKSMCRVIMKVWGADESVYVGRYLMLYGDPTVRFGGVDTGGIRISHMSHIDKETTVVLTTTRSTRKPYTVQPLKVADKPDANKWEADIMAVTTLDELKAKFTQAQTVFKGSADFARIHTAKEKRKAELTEASNVK